ncbi:MAG: helix-turn-helix domain-containing protein [Brachymonas sp.]|nr:helix-turn-helix domain-containing protein [Brachymonas sp.]MDO4795216.1 helix-turn-helix domain-containing protein [Brachymonas sp.]
MAHEQLQACVRHSLQTYLDDLQGQEPSGMYDMVLRVIEKPLLELVMQHTRGNQSKAAQWLGINRNTLRKLLLQHGLLAPGRASR